MKFKILKKKAPKTLSGGKVVIKIGDEIVGTVQNVSYEFEHVTECNCGSKAEKHKLGHKDTCPWWAFAEDRVAPVPYILGKMDVTLNKPITYIPMYFCTDCQAYADKVISTPCQTHSTHSKP